MRQRRPTPRRFSGGPLAIVVLTVALSLLAAGPAFAHGAEGKLTVLVNEAGPGRAVTIEVGILYANDEDPAEEAIVTVTLGGPEAQSVGPVTLTRVGTGGSRYRSEIPVPTAGTWTATISSTGPTAQGTAEVLVPAGSGGITTTTNAAGTAGTAPPTTRADSPITTGTAQLRSVTPVLPSPGSPAAATESTTNTLIAGGLIGLLGITIGGFVMRQRRLRDADIGNHNRPSDGLAGNDSPSGNALDT